MKQPRHRSLLLFTTTPDPFSSDAIQKISYSLRDMAVSKVLTTWEIDSVLTALAVLRLNQWRCDHGRDIADFDVNTLNDGHIMRLRERLNAEKYREYTAQHISEQLFNGLHDTPLGETTMAVMPRLVASRVLRLMMSNEYGVELEAGMGIIIMQDDDFGLRLGDPHLDPNIEFA